MVRPDVSQQRRDQIFRAAVDVVAERGLERSTIAAIAAAAGVSTGTVNYYFKGKQNLLHETLNYVSERIQVRTSAAIDRWTDPRDQLAAVIDALVPCGDDALREWQVWFVAWNEAVRSDEVRLLIEFRLGLWGKLLHDIVARWPGPNRCQTEVDRFAREFDAFLNGLCIDMVVTPSAALTEKAVKESLLAFADFRLGTPGMGSQARR